MTAKKKSIDILICEEDGKPTPQFLAWGDAMLREPEPEVPAPKPKRKRRKKR